MADPVKVRKSALLQTNTSGPPSENVAGNETGAIIANLSRCLNWLDEASLALRAPNLEPDMRAFYLQELPLVTQDTRELIGGLLRNTAAAVTSNDNH